MKRNRQEVIKNIISTHNVETQEELLTLLNKEGFNTTQATISRDIRELNLKKISYEGGRKKYAIKSNPKDVEANDDASYIQVLKNSLISMEHSENIIVIKTVAGMAMAVGASVDRLNISEIMGCIAGDDTLFIAIRDKNMAEKVIGEIKDVIKFAH
ncbi:MAG: arginine repressor [Lachnospiraceae bacterium]|nr:arginine repressor [Lachnospiraceae bacterium]